MGPRGTHWLAALRRKRRGVLLALLPALFLWSASGSACLAMLAAGEPAAVAPSPHDHHAAHANTAHGHENPSPPASHDCPHCPPHSGTATVAHSACTDTSVATLARVATGGAPFDSVAWLPLAHTVPLAVATSIPPLILLPRATADPPAPHVPLNIRHCVLLI